MAIETVDYISISGSHKERDWYITRTKGMRGAATSEILPLGHFETANEAAKKAKEYAEANKIELDDYTKIHAARKIGRKWL